MREAVGSGGEEQRRAAEAEKRWPRQHPHQPCRGADGHAAGGSPKAGDAREDGRACVCSHLTLCLEHEQEGGQRSEHQREQPAGQLKRQQVGKKTQQPACQRFAQWGLRTKGW